MNTLILHPTETAQWYALINEAQAMTNHMLNEDTESYLVYLLMRFAQRSTFHDSILALDFLHCLETSGSWQIELLRDIGDKSLLFAGLFPDLAKRRQVSVDYFTNIGQMAYLRISQLQQGVKVGLYGQLSDQFLILQRILQACDLKQTNQANCLLIFP